MGRRLLSYRVMNEKAETRTETAKPEETRHLNEDQKHALDLHADTEHVDGPKREKLTRKIASLGDSKASGADRR
jgi:hypothetical protein